MQRSCCNLQNREIHWNTKDLRPGKPTSLTYHLLSSIILFIPINFTDARQDTFCFFPFGGGSCFLISSPPEKASCRMLASSLNAVIMLPALQLQLAQLIRADTLEIQMFLRSAFFCSASPPCLQGLFCPTLPSWWKAAGLRKQCQIPGRKRDLPRRDEAALQFLSGRGGSGRDTQQKRLLLGFPLGTSCRWTLREEFAGDAIWISVW